MLHYSKYNDFNLIHPCLQQDTYSPIKLQFEVENSGVMLFKSVLLYVFWGAELESEVMLQHFSRQL